MNAALSLCALGLLACSGAQTSPTCSDEAYVKLAAWCATAAYDCSLRGGTEAECGTVCDDKADDWARRCGQ